MFFIGFEFDGTGIGVADPDFSMPMNFMHLYSHAPHNAKARIICGLEGLPIIIE